MGRKVKTSVALDQEMLDWIAELVQRKRFGSITHAVEYALQRLKETEKEEFHITTATEQSPIIQAIVAEESPIIQAKQCHKN
jgi:Arc/MetJ-type ribon-helix-helix transcriptional regulator